VGDRRSLRTVAKSQLTAAAEERCRLTRLRQIAKFG
jgi:hypothetical protein